MLVFNGMGRPGDTKRIAGSDTALHLPTAYMGATATDITLTGIGRKCGKVLITVEDNAIRFTFNNVTPTNDAGTKVGHVLAAGTSLYLESEAAIKGFRWLNKVGGSAAPIVVTPFVIYDK